MERRKMKELTIKELYTLDETIAKDIFEGATYPWEVLPKIKDFILELGKSLPEDEYDKVGEDVWIAKSAKVFESAYIHGPAIIGKDAEVRHCAFIRGNAIVGGGCGWKFHRAEKRDPLQQSTGAPLQLCGRLYPGIQGTHGRRLHHFQCKVR